MRSCNDLGICHARPGCSICITHMQKPNKTTSHLQQVRPAPLRKSGLHAVEGTLYSNVKKQPLERAAEFDARMRAITVSAEMPIRNSTMRGAYHCPELGPSARPRAMDAYRLPSGGVAEQVARERAEARRTARAPVGQMIPLRRGHEIK